MAVAFTELIKTKSNFIFIGETGSGKSEISLNTAEVLQHQQRGSVHLFDLDQTKALFRSRDAEAEMAKKGISIHYMPQLLDTPVLVNGIIPHLRRNDSFCILDVGGNENAARMVGCLSEYLDSESTAAIYVLNPFRPWSGTIDDIDQTMYSILGACHIDQIHFVANPTIGPDTSIHDVLTGLDLLHKSVPFRELSCIFICEDLLPQISLPDHLEIQPLHRFLTYPWQR